MPHKYPRLSAPDAARTRSPRSTKGTLPDFAPVPRQYERHDGWTPERQQGFIEALADLGNVKSAATQVGMTPEGAYLLRRHPEATGFRRAWEAALKLGVQRLEDVAMERALNGVEVPVYHFGAVVGSRRVHNDRLLMFILRNRAPKRFAADAVNTGNVATRSQLKRLKREWRAEWEAEQVEEARLTHEEICNSINAKLDRMRASQLEDHRAARTAGDTDEAGVTIDGAPDALDRAATGRDGVGRDGADRDGAAHDTDDWDDEDED